MKLTNQIFFLFCFLLFFVNTSSNSHANSNPLANKFAIIDPSTSSSGNIANSNLDIDILVNPIFPNFVSLPPRGDTLGKRVGFAFAGSNPSFEARLNNNKNNITVKSIDLIDNKNKTFFEVPFKITSIPNTEDEVTLTLDIPNTLSSGLAKFILNTNNGIALKGEIEVLDFFNFSSSKESSKFFGEPSISRTSIKKIGSNFFLTIQGKNFAPKNIIYSSKNSPNEKVESTNPSNTSVIILPNTLNLKIDEITVSKGNDSIKVKFTLDSLKNNIDAAVVVTTPRGIISKTLVLKSGVFSF